MNDTRAPGDTSSRAVEALLDATPLLIGVVSRAVRTLDTGVSPTQFRLLRALTELGATPSAVVARRLGSAASTITRLADRLEDSGHLVRRRERPNRSVVRLELTARGRDLVARVEEVRRRDLTSLVERLPAGTAYRVAEALEALTDAAGTNDDHADPIELEAL